MTEILSHLYLSSAKYAKDPSFIQNYSITHILVAAKSLRHYFPEKIVYLQFPISDSPKTAILAFFPQAIEFIDSALSSEKQNVLVHCLGGRSRSVTIVTAYLMFRFNFKSDEALEYVKKKHENTFPNIGFIAQLKQFEFCLEKYFERKLIAEMKGVKIGKEEKKEEEEEEEEEKKADLTKFSFKENNDPSCDSLQSIVTRQIAKNFKK